MDPNLNNLLQWGIKNSDPNAFKPKEGTNGTDEPPRQQSTLDPELLQAIMGGPSDADLMKESMSAILSTDPSISLDDKLIAFDNFEQLIENLDNANNLAPLDLWTPLISLLSNSESEIKKMAAWCVGTAVQNNEKSQEKAVAMGAIPRLVELAVGDEETRDVRRKAVYALSSAGRNYQPAMNSIVEELGKKGVAVGETDASDMDAVDKIMGDLRAEASKSN